MRFVRFLPTSLRTRFIAGMIAMLLPWVAFVAIGRFILLPRVIGAFETTVDKMAEMHSVMNLQQRLLQAAMPPNDYLINGQPVERKQFALLGRATDQAFEDALNIAHLEPERQALIRARAEWQQARLIAESLLALAHPVGNPVAAREMKRLDAHVDRAADILHQDHAARRREADEQLSQVRIVEQRVAQLIVSMFGLALAIAAGGGILLAYSVLASLRTLEEGTGRLGAGDLSHRVDAGRVPAELERLTASFNNMATRLERDQTQLAAIATEDSLTGLCNRREFQRRLEQEVERARRYNHPFSLLMLDLDHFKVVNDTYGHLVGDQVLRAVAALVQAEIRPADQAARFGGEEFTVILPETTGPDALAVAERIRQAIERRPVMFGPQTAVEAVRISVTVSIGAVAFPGDATSADAIIAAADRALYAAKQSGRNQVHHADPLRAPG